MFWRKKSSDEVQIRQEVEFSFRAIGIPGSQAVELARQHLQAAREAVVAAGLSTVGPLGEYMLLRERQGQLPPDVAEVLAVARRDGVTDDDIQAWWNLSPLHRQVMENVNQTTRAAACMSFIEQDEVYKRDKDMAAAMTRAAKRAKETMPWYGDPREPRDAPPDDRNLPPELRKRLALWMAGGRLTRPTSGSFNAHVRALVRQGAL